MKIGENIHTMLKRNNLTVWLLIGLTAIVVISSIAFCTYIYKHSQNNLFAITETGMLVPLEKLDDKKDKLRQVKSNLDYMVSLYYDIDGFTMKEKKEKLFWLLGTQPTEVVKDRDKKGYFNTFLSINGLVQHASIDQSSWKLYSIDEPYKLSFVVNIVRINNGAKNFYTSEVTVNVQEVNRNYPFNPYGLLITHLSENLKVIEEADFRKSQNQNVIENNQND